VTQSRRDGDLNDTDSIQILLDTLNDGQNAFVFGTNPFGIEYDGQVMNEGQTSGSLGRAGIRGSQGGQVSGFNANWDADWTVRAAITTRGWEAEFSIPLKTVRYKPGTGQTWGRECDAEHPPPQRAGISCAGSARVQHPSRVCRGKTDGTRSS
jgi:hypothetical protein